MDITKTAEAIKKWISSCINEEQLELCKDAVDVFVKERFWAHRQSVSFCIILSELDLAINQKAQSLKALEYATDRCHEN